MIDLRFLRYTWEQNLTSLFGINKHIDASCPPPVLNSFICSRLIGCLYSLKAPVACRRDSILVDCNVAICDESRSDSSRAPPSSRPYPTSE